MKINTMGSDHIVTDEIQPLDRLWGEGRLSYYLLSTDSNYGQMHTIVWLCEGMTVGGRAIL